MEHPKTSRRDFLKELGSGIAALGALRCENLLAAEGSARQPNSLEKKPNFIVIFTDDQGYADVGCFGSDTIKTPRLDQMARDGMKLTSFYSQTVCGPARCSLLTGCYPTRVKGFNSYSISEWCVAEDEITIAEILKEAGYATGCIGKWDISGRRFREGMVPNDQGFGFYFGTLGANDSGHVELWRNKEKVRTTSDMGSLTALYTDEALRFIREKKNEPFFLYLAHTMPHIRLGVSDSFRCRSSRAKGGQYDNVNDLYADVIEEIDWNVGRILDAVCELSLDRNTYILFTSDNGPWISHREWGAGSAKPLRMGKGSAWEGGFRVPCIVWGPSRVPAGRESNELMATLDILPTFAALAGATEPTDRVIDGRNQSALITGKTDKGARDSFFYYIRGNLHAVRDRKWKLAIPNRKRFYSYANDKATVTRPELYDLENDISEKHDMADKHPDIVQRLLKLAEAARQDLGDVGIRGKNAR